MVLNPYTAQHTGINSKPLELLVEDYRPAAALYKCVDPAYTLRYYQLPRP